MQRRKLFHMLRDISHYLSMTNVSAYAASAAFFVFLSLIPVLILICSLLPFTPLEEQDLLTVVQGMPEPVVPVLSAMVSSVYDSTVGTVSTAALVTVWSAGKGMLALMRGLNAMNGVEESRNYVVQRIVASFYTVVLLILLLLSLVLMVFGNTLVRVLSVHLPFLRDLLNLLLYLKPVFTWGVLTVAFMLIYAFVPNIRLRLRGHFFGAMFAAVSWNLFSFGFSFYLETFNDMSLYGSLSAIVVIMLWLYFCMYLLLVGAFLNRLLEAGRLSANLS